MNQDIKSTSQNQEHSFMLILNHLKKKLGKNHIAGSGCSLLFLGIIFEQDQLNWFILTSAMPCLWQQYIECLRIGRWSCFIIRGCHRCGGGSKLVQGNRVCMVEGCCSFHLLFILILHFGDFLCYTSKLTFL